MKPIQHIVDHIVELGTVTDLTLGTGIYAFENRYTPVGISITKPHVTHLTELGKATDLTLGSGGSKYENSSRPNNPWHI
jgi:hypothetical protein